MQIENLAAVVHAIAKSCGAKTVVGVGSGQVCHLHASSCAIVARFQVDTTIFLILGQLASFFIALSCDYAILSIRFTYSLLNILFSKGRPHAVLTAFWKSDAIAHSLT